MDEEDERDRELPAKLGLTGRVGLLERDSRSHARSLTEIVKVVANQGDDLKKLAAWQLTRLVAEAHEEERDKALYGRLDGIDASIKAMRGAGTRALWIVAGVVIPAVILGIAIVLVLGAKLAGSSI